MTVSIKLCVNFHFSSDSVHFSFISVLRVLKGVFEKQFSTFNSTKFYDKISDILLNVET